MKIDLELTSAEKSLLKEKKITQKSLANLAIDEIISVLNPEPAREKILRALFEFQTIPSIGVKFAKDLILLSYYKLADLKDLNGPDLLDSYEQKIGYRIDPCVEDQFWLVVEYANNPQSKKQWWHFTSHRKACRSKHGYPANRPQQVIYAKTDLIWLQEKSI